jgi:hypothetical protein
VGVEAVAVIKPGVSVNILPKRMQIKIK